MKIFESVRLVKGEDLNHHNTLFAGRMVEWFVESSFITATKTYGSSNIVCLELHNLRFFAPVKKGESITFITKAIKVGKSSITIYGKVLNSKDTKVSEGYATFVTVDDEGRKIPHNIILDNQMSEDELELIN